jgi:hypothetical protein
MEYLELVILDLEARINSTLAAIDVKLKTGITQLPTNEYSVSQLSKEVKSLGLGKDDGTPKPINDPKI